MGAIIEQLGYKLVWSAGSCKLYPPDGKSRRVRVKNGCPELVESQALTLISRLEEQQQMHGAHATVIGHLLFTPAAQGALFEPHARKD